MVETQSEEEEKEQKGEMGLFENIFSLNFFFKLSGLVIVYTASLLVQEHRKSVLWRNFM